MSDKDKSLREELTDRLQPVTVRYRTIDDGIRQGLKKGLDDKRNEIGGILFRDSKTGEYYIGGEPSKGNRDKVEITGWPLAAGDKPAAIYHTHPNTGSLKDRDYSENDLDAAHQLNVPMYLGTERAGQRRAMVYDPSKQRRPGRRNPTQGRETGIDLTAAELIDRLAKRDQ